MASGGIDLIERDPNHLNDHVKVEFEDVLGEPDGTHSCECTWQMSNTCFTCCKNCWYKYLTGICGICIALWWGCEFATITFDQVWCSTPFLRVFSTYMGCCQKFFGNCVQCCLAPLCETAGLCFSRIVVMKPKD